MPAVPTLDPKPFYAYVGAGDAAFESLRTAVVTLPEAFNAFPDQLKTVPASLKAARVSGSAHSAKSTGAWPASRPFTGRPYWGA